MEKFTAHMVHTLELSQFVPADPGRVWEFFSNPRNLRDLIPPKMDFRILGDPGPMYAGQMIAYRIRVAPGVRVGWLTEILHVTPGCYFVDEQRVGPYRLWHHEHHFLPRDGGVEMRDRVTYSIGFGPVGEAAHSIWVKRQLDGVFEFRKGKVQEIFG